MRALHLSLDSSTLPLIRTLYWWVLNKEVSSTIFKVFVMIRPGIEPRSPRPLVNTLPTRPICCVNFTTWMLTKCIEKRLDGNCTRMLQAILNKSWEQHPTKQLFTNLPPISKTIQIRWTRHMGYYWRSKYELISDVLQWNPSQGCARSNSW